MSSKRFPSTRSSKTLRALTLVAAASLLLGACSSDEEPPPTASSPSPSPSPTPDPTCPLTGETPAGKVDLERPAVAVKIENSPAARPQAGLEDADIVFEEIVEGGITRFMAIYHCGSSKQAGPVRSARFDDPKIASPYTKALAFSGSNSIVENELRARDMLILDEDNSGEALFRVPPGVLEIHNLFANTEGLRKLAVKEKIKPPKEDLLEFGELPDGAKKARRVTVNFTASNTIEYRWKGGAWKRSEAGLPFLTADGGQIAVPNVLIQQVQVNNSTRIFDVAGNPSPDISLVGKGKALLFRDGKVVKGTWNSKSEGAMPKFRTKSGDPFVFAEGPIWVELVPAPSGTVKGTLSYR